MSNLDKALNIYQSYSLAKISTLNKKSLAIQYAQCGEIIKLKENISKELQAVNRINQKILENQINELKQRERIKFYRKVAFNAKEAIEIINSQKDLLFKSFLCELYAIPLQLLLEDAINNLEEINDKEFCSNQIKILDSCLMTIEQVKKDYNLSDYHNIIISQEAYSDSMKNIENKIKQVNRDRKNIEPFVEEKLMSIKVYCGCLRFFILIAFLFIVFVMFGIANSVGDKEDMLIGIEILGFNVIIVAILFWLYFSRKKKYAEYVENVNKRNIDNQNEYERRVEQINEKLKMLQQEQHDFSISHPYNVSLEKINIENPGWRIVVEKLRNIFQKKKK
ncbi:MAG: hypothetical protein J1F06_02220 [Prevotellaceae bacterium]|nr:hypothetical protein [Prevotellaceae bacterium]